MARLGPMEPNAVRRETGEHREYLECDRLDRVIYKVAESSDFSEKTPIELIEKYEYYKDTHWLTKVTVAYKTSKESPEYVLFENKADYLDDGDLIYLKLMGSLEGLSNKTTLKEIKSRKKKKWRVYLYYKKEYDSQGRLKRYKDSNGVECKWKYDKNGRMQVNMISTGKKDKQKTENEESE